MVSHQVLRIQFRHCTACLVVAALLLLALAPTASFAQKRKQNRQQAKAIISQYISACNAQALIEGNIQHYVDAFEVKTYEYRMQNANRMSLIKTVMAYEFVEFPHNKLTFKVETEEDAGPTLVLATANKRLENWAGVKHPQREAIVVTTMLQTVRDAFKQFGHHTLLFYEVLHAAEAPEYMGKDTSGVYDVVAVTGIRTTNTHQVLFYFNEQSHLLERVQYLDKVTRLSNYQPVPNGHEQILMPFTRVDETANDRVISEAKGIYLNRPFPIEFFHRPPQDDNLAQNLLHFLDTLE